MKQSKKNFIFASFLLLLLNWNCHKTPSEATLPESVDLGKSVVFLNGQEMEYTTDFKMIAVYKTLNYSFSQQKQDVTNVLGFGLLPIHTGDFVVTSGKEIFIKPHTFFNQFLSGDLDGYSYELINPEKGFLKIEALDTTKLEVKGRFRAEFCRTSKNGTKDDITNLSKNLLFQGVFYDKYKKV